MRPACYYGIPEQLPAFATITVTRGRGDEDDCVKVETHREMFIEGQNSTRWWDAYRPEYQTDYINEAYSEE